MADQPVQPDVLVLRPTGREAATLSQTDQIRSIIPEPPGRNPAARVVVSLERVDMMASAGLNGLVALRRQVVAAGGRMRLACVPPRILELFEVTRLRRSFDIDETVQDAVKAIRAP